MASTEQLSAYVAFAPNLFHNKASLEVFPNALAFTLPVRYMPYSTIYNQLLQLFCLS
jgi:hypothetical protein